MSVRRYTEINCDGHGSVVGTCGLAYSDVGNADQVRRDAARYGWSVSRPGGKDYCPDHCDKASAAVSQ